MPDHIWPSGVRETTSITGTGAYVLDGAAAGYFTFGSVMVAGDTVDACVRLGANREYGRYTMNSGGALERTAILRSTNSNAAVNWAAGTKDIFAVHIGFSDLDATGLSNLALLVGTVGLSGSPSTGQFPRFAGAAALEGLTAAAYRAALDLEAGTDFLSPSAIAAAYQPLAAALTSLASASANGVSLVTAANYAAMRALLDLEGGTDFLTPSAIAAAYQPLAAALTSLSGATANGIAVATAANYAAMRALLDLEPGVDYAAFPASSTLPVGYVGTMRYTGAGSLADGATTAGTNVQTLAFTGDFGSLGLNVAAGQVQTGTWRNINGTALRRISSDNDGEQIGVMQRIP